MGQLPNESPFRGMAATHGSAAAYDCVMSTIGEAGNTVVPAALALEQLGFRVEASPKQTIATKGELRVVASDPLSALGLAALVQVRGENWQAGDDDIEVWLSRLTE